MKFGSGRCWPAAAPPLLLNLPLQTTNAPPAAAMATPTPSYVNLEHHLDSFEFVSLVHEATRKLTEYYQLRSDAEPLALSAARKTTFQQQQQQQQRETQFRQHVQPLKDIVETFAQRMQAAKEILSSLPGVDLTDEEQQKEEADLQRQLEMYSRQLELIEQLPAFHKSSPAAPKVEPSD